MNTNTLLSVRKVSVQRNSRVILDDVDVDVLPGKITTIIGPNGAGKTTLMRIMLGLEKTNSGVVHKRRGISIGYMPQKLQLPEHMPMSVKEFIRLGKRVKSSFMDAVSNETGITTILHQQMATLSGGEHQRVLLCRALIRNPDLLILDEPVQGVDVSGQSALYQLIADIRKRRGCAVVMVSHDLHLVMAATDEVLCLNRHVCCAGHPQSVTRSSAYLDLFGPEVERSMALYTHHHDHRHGIHGDVIDDGCNHG